MIQNLIYYYIHIYILGILQQKIISKLFLNKTKNLKKIFLIFFYFILVIGCYRIFYEFYYLKNIYKEFNLNRNSEINEIKKIYKKFLINNHPDRNLNSNKDLFIIYREQFESLMDNQKKWFYDRLRFTIISDKSNIKSSDISNILSNLIEILMKLFGQFFMIFFVEFFLSKFISIKNKIISFLIINILILGLFFEKNFFIYLFNFLFSKWTVFDFIEFINFSFPAIICFSECKLISVLLCLK